MASCNVLYHEQKKKKLDDKEENGRNVNKLLVQYTPKNLDSRGISSFVEALQLLSWLSWLEHLDGSRKVLGPCPGSSLAFKEDKFACGKRVKHEVHFDQKLIENLSEIAKKSGIPFAVGKTLSCDDFYEAQGRLDGAFCMFDQQEKLEFMNKIHHLGVRNIEMEATAFSAMTTRAGHKLYGFPLGAVVCVTLVNRLLNDQVTSSHETLKSWEESPCKIVASLIKESLSTAAGKL
uniref:Nucleoside phosphorylase domain-containing protein n=1 Tax=Romanomermis culicivorax TaxID=13658 RepID=A0A915JX19_ROMCU